MTIKKPEKPEVNFQLLCDTFDKEWIEDIATIYSETIKKVNNAGYFGGESGIGPGLFFDRYKVSGGPPLEIIQDHFKNLFYIPNFGILNFLILNKKWFSDKLIVDSGCGVGILSVFMDKIGIKCYNYDNMSQTGDSHNNDFLREVNRRHDRDIPYVNKEDDYYTDFQVVTLASCNGLSSKLSNPDVFLLDSGWQNLLPSETHTIVYDYSPMMVVSVKNGMKIDFRSS